MKLYKKGLVCLLLFCILISVPLTARASGEDDSECFNLDPCIDGFLFGGGILLNAGAIAIEEISEPAEKLHLDNIGNISSVNSFDRLCVYSYSKPLDMASDILTYSALLSPAVLLAVSDTDRLTIGTMYAESVIWAWGLKECCKNLVHRNRPYTYFDGYPQSEIRDGDFRQSFPSGHTTLAFTGASFSTFVFNRYFEDSPWRIPVITASYSLAVGSAVLRVASGNHFLTDVIAGAAIGTFSGFMVPWLHTLNMQSPGEAEPGIKSFSIAVVPYGINARLSF